MSFFKEFKDEFDDAASEENGVNAAYDEEATVNTLDEQDEEAYNLEGASEEEDGAELLKALMQEESERAAQEVTTQEASPEIPTEEVKRDKDFADLSALKNQQEISAEGRGEATSDTTVITKGTTINGSISSDCSLEVMGTIIGDIDCLGKLSILGKVRGNSAAAEVYVNTAKLEGAISSEGSVKIGVGTVVVGDITAASGVIAGAVKGQIDVNGPVIIDSTAVIKGNINAKAVQVNNGAVIDGYCSLTYSDVDIDTFFED